MSKNLCPYFRHGWLPCAMMCPATCPMQYAALVSLFQLLKHFSHCKTLYIRSAVPCHVGLNILRWRQKCVSLGLASYPAQENACDQPAPHPVLLAGHVLLGDAPVCVVMPVFERMLFQCLTPIRHRWSQASRVGTALRGVRLVYQSEDDWQLASLHLGHHTSQ
jgi:hypothetical protein